MKSEAKVKLAIAVKEMTLGEVFSTDYLSKYGNWDAWWQRRGHAQILQDDNADEGQTQQNHPQAAPRNSGPAPQESTCRQACRQGEGHLRTTGTDALKIQTKVSEATRSVPA